MKILAIIVTYNPDFKLLETVKKIKKQVDKLIVVDNNSQTKEVFNLLKKDSKIETVENIKNIGLAAAQNIGIKKSIEEKFDWVLFLDDDSEIKSTLIFELKKEYFLSNNREKIGIVASNILYKNIEKITSYPIKNKFFIKRIKFSEETSITNVMFTISSGSLIRVKVIEEIGLLKENFFIDHIDVEFCLRLNLSGYKIIVVKNAFLYQTVGKASTKKFFNLSIFPTNHDPKRQFTKFRNAIWTWKKYFIKEKKYVIYDILLMINHLLRVLLFEKRKKENLFNIFKGIYIGIKKKELD